MEKKKRKMKKKKKNENPAYLDIFHVISFRDESFCSKIFTREYYYARILYTQEY